MTHRVWPAVLAALLALAAPAQAGTLLVGPDRQFKMPSEAVAAAVDGDTVLIDPGEYFDCIVPRADHLVIAGAAPGVVLTDRPCDGKALVVAVGNDMELRLMTLQRARVPDGNGAGIRVEGRNLTIRQVNFVNNQAGIIISGTSDSAVEIHDSRFTDNGICDGDRCVGAVVAGAIARLRIDRSTIEGTRGGEQIVSQAWMTELADNRITDGPTGASGYQLLLSGGGGLRMENNIIEKGPKSGNTRAAILVEDTATEITIRGNRFDNDTGTPMPFILNWAGADPLLAGNVMAPSDWQISSRGKWWHELGQGLRATKDGVRHLGGAALRLGKAGLRRVRDWF